MTGVLDSVGNGHGRGRGNMHTETRTIRPMAVQMTHPKYFHSNGGSEHAGSAKIDADSDDASFSAA